MDLGLQYEIQRSRPHCPGFMYDIYHQATEQVILADKLGFHSVWQLSITLSMNGPIRRRPRSGTARSARSPRISASVTASACCPFHSTIRCAWERIAVLDIMSNGRVECGTGRSITEQELGGFNINPEDSRPMWEEAVAQIPKMWTQEIYEGYEGKYFQIPPREVIPSRFRSRIPRCGWLPRSPQPGKSPATRASARWASASANPA